MPWPWKKNPDKELLNQWRQQTRLAWLQQIPLRLLLWQLCRCSEDSKADARVRTGLSLVLHKLWLLIAKKSGCAKLTNALLLKPLSRLLSHPTFQTALTNLCRRVMVWAVCLALRLARMFLSLGSPKW